MRGLRDRAVQTGAALTSWLAGARGRRVAGWLAVLAVLAWFQAQAVAKSLRHAEGTFRINDDARAQIFPFFKYFDATAAAFANDYVTDYYLACFPSGYFGLYAAAARLGVDPVALSRYLPHVAWLATVFFVGIAANKLGGRLAALAAMALVLGTNFYLGRMAGGLPRTFAYPILAAALAALAYDRVGWCALCVLAGALFYPVVAVISGFSLAALVLFANFVGSSVRSWSWGRRLGFLVGTAALAFCLLLPSAISSARFGDLVRPDAVREFPEIGRGGRFDSDSRAPFRGFFESFPKSVDGALVGARPGWSEAGRHWLSRGKKKANTRNYRDLKDALLVVVLLGGAGLFVRRPSARRVFLLGAASWGGHTIAVWAAPYAYMPERYVICPIPLLATLAVSSAIAGFFPPWFDRRPGRWLKTAVIGAYVAVLLVLLAGRVSPAPGLVIKLREGKPLFDFIAGLPPKSLLAGWPKGTLDAVPFAARRPVLVTHEVHQAFHDGYIVEMRRRVRGVVDAYFATSAEPIVRLREEFGVTHLLVDRDHFDSKPPTYFKPFDAWIAERRAAARGKRYELLRQMSKAKVFSHRGQVILDLARIELPKADAGRRSQP